MTLQDPFDRRPYVEFPVRHVASTRWSDNDMYGHLNNAVYYALFDSAINTWTGLHGGSGFAEAPVMGVVAESGCRYHAQVAFPGPVTVGLSVVRLGRSSVTYRLGLFGGDEPADADLASATARWVHVYVDRRTGRPVEIPAPLREAMAGALADPTLAG
jgi:acyl-CoA thioester hydrolase